MANEFGIELKLAPHSDNTATISQYTKMDKTRRGSSGCGRNRGSQEKLAIIWKCWAAEGVERSENTWSWAGAMGTRAETACDVDPTRQRCSAHVFTREL